MARYVFISYSRVDKAYVTRLREAMARHGVPTWLDTGIEHGARWSAALRDAIDGSAAVVVVMTPDAERSTWVEREIQRAENGMKPIMPVLLDGTCLFGLTHLQHEDIRGGTLPGTAFFDTLRRLVQDATDAAPTAASPSSPDGDPTVTPATEIFEKVVARFDKPAFRRLTSQTVGRLLVENGRLLFSSPKLDLEIDNIAEVDYGRFGSDVFNVWVKIDFRSVADRRRTIYLADFTGLGYGGLFGGTRQIEQSVRRAFQYES